MFGGPYVYLLFGHNHEPYENGRTDRDAVCIDSGGLCAPGQHSAKRLKKSARDTHVLVCNFAKIIFANFKEIFTDRLSNKPFLIWLLTTPPRLKYVATLPCNLLLIACSLTLMFHKVVWQHTQGVVELLVTTLPLTYQGIFQ